MNADSDNSGSDRRVPPGATVVAIFVISVVSMIVGATVGFLTASFVLGFLAFLGCGGSLVALGLYWINVNL
jgi:hypothetical protein